MNHRQIALAFPITLGHHQEIIQGIVEWARKHDQWTLIIAPETADMSVLDLKGWRGHGVITDILTPPEARAARNLGIPLVNLSGEPAGAGLPRVVNDQQAMGRLAAEHLLRCGIRRFGYYGLKNAWYARQRGQGFSERLSQAGHSCAVLEADSMFDKKGHWHRWLEDLRRWLKRLQPPFGVLAAHDNRARMVVDACHHLGLAVPHDVAVVGVDNDRLACEVSRPTLSSIARNGWEIGYRAAQLLERLLGGRRLKEQDVIVAPAGVIARESTDMVAVDDPDLSLAVRLIRARLAQPFTVEELLRDLSVSRRWLEYRFQERFGHSPRQYIAEARVERAKQLLTEARPPSLEAIANACGFTAVRSLRLTFRRFTGMTPREYRRSRQAGKPTNLRVPE